MANVSYKKKSLMRTLTSNFNKLKVANKKLNPMM